MAGTPITIKEVDIGFVIRGTLTRPAASALTFYLGPVAIQAMGTPIKVDRQRAETDLLHGAVPVGLQYASIFSESTTDLTRNPLCVSPGG